MAGGFGLRTMSADDAGVQPAVATTAARSGRTTPRSSSPAWPAPGFAAPAATLADGLLAAAEAFDYRLPELYGGDDRAALGRPVPYPAACRPQAWSAAAGGDAAARRGGPAPRRAGRHGHGGAAGGAPLGAVTVAGCGWPASR